MNQTYCAFHPRELIVNFCRNQSCLLPMCPNCVKVHSKEHTQENTFGQYQHIETIYSQVEQNIQNVLKSLVSSNEDLKEVYCQKQQRRKNLKKKMKQYKLKILSSIQNYIDQLQGQIITSMGGKQSNIQQDFNLINDKIQQLSKQVEKQVRLISGEKRLKGIINHFSHHMPEYYDQKIDLIQDQIVSLQSKDINVCKQFKIAQISSITDQVHELYKSIFVGTIRPIQRRLRDSRMSRKSQISLINQSTQ